MDKCSIRQIVTCEFLKPKFAILPGQPVVSKIHPFKVESLCTCTPSIGSGSSGHVAPFRLDKIFWSQILYWHHDLLGNTVQQWLLSFISHRPLALAVRDRSISFPYLSHCILFQQNHNYLNIWGRVFMAINGEMYFWEKIENLFVFGKFEEILKMHIYVNKCYLLINNSINKHSSLNSHLDFIKI